MFDLTTQDIKYLPGVGPQRAVTLNKELGIYTLHDLLYYFPYKYVDRSRIYSIREIDGTMPYIQLKGEIRSFELAGEGRQRRLIAQGNIRCIRNILFSGGQPYLMDVSTLRTLMWIWLRR